MITMGLLTAFAFYIFILKLPSAFRRRLLGFDLLVDIAATILMMLAFAGTFSGMAAAIFGGVVFSALLIITKWVSGYEKPFIWKDNGRLRWTWIQIPGWRSRRVPGSPSDSPGSY